MGKRSITLADAYFGKLKNFTSNGSKSYELDKFTRKLSEQYLELMKQFPPEQIEEQKKIPEKLFEKLKTSGFFGISIPKNYGGLGLDIYQYLALVEIMASHCMSVGLTVLAHLSIGVKGIIIFGNEEQKSKYLPQAASGEKVFSYALTEPETGSDAQNIKTRAFLDEQGRNYILNGSKTYITNASYAGAMTVFARLDSGRLGAFIVETDWDGVEVGEEMPKMGLKGSSTAFVRFKNVKVPKKNLLGDENEGFKIAMTILNHGRLALGAASSGMIKLSLKDMVRRSSSRKQFGVSIDSFELIREKLLQAKVYGEITTAMTAFAAGVLDRDEKAAAAVETSHCKLFGTTSAWRVLYDALQTAGGAGYLATLPYERRMRDFRVTTIFEGTTEIHSAYPALFLVKKLANNLQSRKLRIMEKFVFALGLLFPNLVNSFQVQDKELETAVRLSAHLTRKLLFLCTYGLFRYGKKIKNKQFLLRRISFLSMYSFGILSMISKIETAGRNREPVNDHKTVLRCFVKEARNYNRQKAGLFSFLDDSLQRSAYRSLFSKEKSAIK
jgi:acyl-CoA dehydrogenase family protein 9